MDASRRARVWSKGDESEDDTAGLATLQALADQYDGGTVSLPQGGTFSIARHPSDPCPVS